MKTALFILTCLTAFSHAITSEQWTGLPANPSLLTLQREGIAKRAANSTTVLANPALTNLAAGTGVRVRALLTAPTTGTYTFAISGSNNTTLWLSTDASRFSKQPIAWHYEPTTAQQWIKFTSQQSTPIALTAGTTYYIEAQVMSNLTGGHLTLGWKTPGSTTITAIPGTHLAPITQDPNDLNDNNLPDDFEGQTGLSTSSLLGALNEYGDPDNDGITNFDEYRLQSHPLIREVRPDGLTRDTWQEIQGQSTAHLTAARTRFFSHPNTTSHVPNIDQTSPNKIEGKNYAARYRGFLIAPVTGTYHLSISADDDAELWFADGTVLDPATATPLTNRFGKQLLAHTHQTVYKTYRDFDLHPTQRTRALLLTAGQTYYIEVLHKNESIAGNHISVAWEIPGQPRAIIPASAFHSDLPEASDPDRDCLPTDWESAKGLSLTDNGFTNAKEGQYGDFDADGLNNLLEYQLGTNPKVADTDGDTLSDGAEVNYYRTNPLVSQAIPTTVHTTANLHAPLKTSIAWEKNTDGTITAYERRGWIEWPVTIAPGQQGVYEIRLVASISPSALTLPISYQLNGQVIHRSDIALKTTANTTTPFKTLTPFLPAGTHTLRFQNHNARADFYPRIHSLTFHRLGGADANANGIADWAETQYAAGNRLNVLPTSSLTSPAYIEGNTSLFSALKLSYTPPTADSISLSPSRAIDDIFFARVPLDATGATTFTYSFQNGESPQTHLITWATTNVMEHNTLTIRAGDALRLTAHEPAAEPSGTFTLTGSAEFSPLTSSSSTSIPHTFTQPGTYTLTSTWTPEEGEPQTHTLTLIVRSADFGAPFYLETYNRNTWDITGISGSIIEADSSLHWRETTSTATATTRSFLANAYVAGDTHVIARCPDTGHIIAVGKVSAFTLTRAGESADAQTVMVRPDGSKVIRFTITGENLPANVEIRLRLNYQGSTFPDGSRDLVLRRSNFSSSGVADIIVETSSDPPQICHSMTAWIVD
jgi:hypothetical protein